VGLRASARLVLHAKVHAAMRCKHSLGGPADPANRRSIRSSGECERASPMLMTSVTEIPLSAPPMPDDDSPSGDARARRYEARSS